MEIDNKKNNDKIDCLKKAEECLFFDLLIPSVYRVVTSKNLPALIKESLSKASSSSLLLEYKEREVISLDCRTLKKGDAYGWMVSLSKKVKENPNLIVVIENITEIPCGPHCDDPQYVENLLGHSWKNKSIYFGDYHIDRTKLTVILTASPDNSEKLGQKYCADSYAWIPNFDKEWDELQQESFFNSKDKFEENYWIFLSKTWGRNNPNVCVDINFPMPNDVD